MAYFINNTLIRGLKGEVGGNNTGISEYIKCKSKARVKAETRNDDRLIT